MENVFEGIDEKLKRANQNVRNLEAEIATFFQEGRYAVLPEDDDELLLEALEYHKQRTIPLRFSVLTGEIIHHLRSCLDHVVWQFSSEEYRRDHFRRIEFPIFETEPVDKNSISRYEGKIKGITNPAVRNMIQSLQPYNAPDPIDSPLLIIHNMDVFDKHRELVLCVPTGALELPMATRDLVESYKRAHPESTPAELTMKFQRHGKLVPQVSFRNFGRREVEAVVPGLVELNNCIVHLVAQFAREIL